MALQTQDAERCRGKTLTDHAGEKLGRIEDIYFDIPTGEPEWAVVKIDWADRKLSFVPIRDASLNKEGVRVPYEKDRVKDAPQIKADGEISHEEERRLCEHYSLKCGEPSELRPGRHGEAMTRSEEELDVDTVQRETGRARLRKYVVTEQVQQSVPVRREEVRVERERITGDEARSGAEISEAEQEVTLRAEEPVVEKRVVPKERVRLSTESVTDEEQISEEVRKERIGEVREERIDNERDKR